MFKVLKVSALLLGLLVGTQAIAKVGYVDIQSAMMNSAAGKKAKATLDSDYEKRKKDLDKRKADIEKIGQDLEKKRAVLSEEVFAKRQMELQEQMMAFQKTVADNQRDIQEKERELVEPILKKMRTVIEKVAAEQSFTLVIEKQGNNILFAAKDADLTEVVRKRFESEK